MEEKINRKISDYGVAGYNETRADAIKQVDHAWQRPIRRFNVPTEYHRRSDQQTDANLTERIQRKLERIIIPKLEFREATIREAIEFLKKKSIELDIDSERRPERGQYRPQARSAVAAAAAAPCPKPMPAGVPGIPGLEPAPAMPAMPAAGRSDGHGQSRRTPASPFR